MNSDPTDLAIRHHAFEWLRDQVSIHGEVLPWSLLLHGFTYRGQRVPLLSQQGIFKPRIMALPLSIRTSPGGPYDDSFGSDRMLAYRYRGTDPNLGDNVRLREAMRQRVPLVYLYGHVKGRYHALWPAFIVGDDPHRLTFTVSVESEQDLPNAAVDTVGEGLPELARAYATSLARRRLHQRGFRERVVHAYREQCAVCQLRHSELLDAAHIIPDREEEGLPVVSNGLALCKLHHAAFDAQILGIRPDYVTEIREDILEEVDGPMLQHGLKGVHGRQLIVPRKREWRPDRERLELRYERWRGA